jgi:hypothetical protein
VAYITLAQAVRAQCERTGLSVPATVIGSTDKQIVQMRALLEEICSETASRGRWRDLTFEKSLTTLGDESISLASIDANFSYIIPETFWDRTNDLPLLPDTPRDWQFKKATSITGPNYNFRLRGQELIVTPAPPAGLIWTFEYVISAWILTVVGSRVDSFTNDGDKIILPPDLVKLGLRWKWKREKGLTYEEDFNSFEMMLTDALGRDEPSPTLHLDRREVDRMPGIFIPAGNWVV